MARVLILEPDPDTRVLLSRWVTRMGHEVEAHGTPTGGFTALVDRRFDALLIDAEMPMFDGFEVVRALQARGVAGAGIAITSVLEREEAPEGVVFDAWLTKPFSRREVQATVRRLLALTDARRHPWKPSPTDVTEHGRWS